MTRTALWVWALLCTLALVSGCGSDSESGTSDTSSSGADTSGADTSGADTSGTGTSGADTSGDDTSTSGTDTSTSGGGCEVTIPSGTKTALSYEADIKPLLEAKTCLQSGCHTPFNGFVSGDLDLSTLGQGSVPAGESGPAYIPCDAANSNLIKFSAPGCRESQRPSKQMPPSGAPFTAEEAALIYQWIQEGGEATFNAATCGE